MDELTSIKIEIAGKEYTISIEKKDETIIREAAQMINEKMEEYDKPQYKGAERGDLLSMLALNLATAIISKDKNIKNLQEDIIEKLSTIDSKLPDTV